MCDKIVIRIRMDPHSFGSVDPDSEYGSGFRHKPEVKVELNKKLVFFFRRKIMFFQV